MASEIRVDKINSLSGVGTVTLSPTGVDIAGITTAATLRATTGIVTSLTAGSLTSLGAVSGTTGTFSAAVSGTTGTFSAAVSGTTGTFSSDVKSTAGIVDIRSGSSINTNVTGASASGTLHKNTTSGEFAIVSGGTGGANHLSLYTSASAAPTEKLRITSGGQVNIGNSISQTSRLFTAENTLADGGEIAYIGNNDGASNYGGLIISAGETDRECRLESAWGNSFITFYTNSGSSTEKLRITSSGDLGLGTISPSDNIHIAESGATNNYIRFSNSNISNGWSVGAQSGGRFQIVQNGVADRFFIESNGNVTVNSGNLIIGTSGKGIDFSAAGNAGGMSNEVLDDYEEGTWTPTLNGVTEPSWHQQVGTYTKIGSLVHCDMWLQASSTTNSTSAILIDLPFTVSNVNASRPTSGSVRVYGLRNWGSYRSALGFATSDNADINVMWVSTGANPGSMNMNIWQNGAELHASITYNTHQ